MWKKDGDERLVGQYVEQLSTSVTTAAAVLADVFS